MTELPAMSCTNEEVKLKNDTLMLVKKVVTAKTAFRSVRGIWSTRERPLGLVVLPPDSVRACWGVVIEVCNVRAVGTRVDTRTGSLKRNVAKGQTIIELG